MKRNPKIWGRFRRQRHKKTERQRRFFLPLFFGSAFIKHANAVSDMKQLLFPVDRAYASE